jgi:hypothetical protein
MKNYKTYTAALFTMLIVIVASQGDAHGIS